MRRVGGAVRRASLLISRRFATAGLMVIALPRLTRELLLFKGADFAKTDIRAA